MQINDLYTITNDLGTKPGTWMIISLLYLVMIPAGIKNRDKYARWDKARLRQKRARIKPWKSKRKLRSRKAR
jgi:hypothetical protein